MRLTGHVIGLLKEYMRDLVEQARQEAQPHMLCIIGLGLGLVERVESQGVEPGPRTVEQALAIELTPIVTDGLRNPLYVTHAGDGSGRMFVVEQPGRIRIVENGRLLETPFLEISSRVRSGGEQGLLGLAFHPDYRRNVRPIINYHRDSDGATVLAEYRVSDNPKLAGQDEKLLMVVPQPYANHNGGMVGFGPDGFLYIARGDGGAGAGPGEGAPDRQEGLREDPH